MADDDEIVADVAVEALSAAGHAVGLLTDGTDMMRVLRAKKPDLVILDCNMPEKNGILVLREMRNSIDLYDLPVLMLTGRRGKGDVDIAMYEGASDYMKKPFDPDELVFRVEEMLESRRAAASRVQR
jgi:DNA-binding response OmpR family regulator